MKKDRRYTINREYCGYSKPRWVVRFCGVWCGSYHDRKNAVKAKLELIGQI